MTLTAFPPPNGDRSHRFSVTVPASIRIDDQQFTAKLTNVVHGGARLESSGLFAVGAKATIHCGMFAADAIIIWQACGKLGVRFTTPLTDAELDE